MPIHEYVCADCGKSSELLILGADDRPECRTCGSTNLKRKLSVPASYSGTTGGRLPGPGDTGCCGQSPGHAGCAGPGSCCGKG